MKPDKWTWDLEARQQVCKTNKPRYLAVASGHPSRWVISSGSIVLIHCAISLHHPLHVMCIYCRHLQFAHYEVCEFSPLLLHEGTRDSPEENCSSLGHCCSSVALEIFHWDCCNGDSSRHCCNATMPRCPVPPPSPFLPSYNLFTNIYKPLTGPQLQVTRQHLCSLSHIALHSAPSFNENYISCKIHCIVEREGWGGWGIGGINIQCLIGATPAVLICPTNVPTLLRCTDNVQY